MVSDKATVDYLVFCQYFITSNNFLNVLAFSSDANDAIISAYSPDLYMIKKIAVNITNHELMLPNSFY